MDTYGYAPCEYEDSPGPCYWDASIMGNGTGTSFVVHADQSVEYGETYLPEPLPLDVEQPVGIPNTETGTSTAQPVEYDELAYTGPLEVTALGIIGVAVIIAGFMLRRKF